jgi:hypothetical protein
MLDTRKRRSQAGTVSVRGAPTTVKRGTYLPAAISVLLSLVANVTNGQEEISRVFLDNACYMECAATARERGPLLPA